MKPLFHPSAEDITVEGILHALADPVRMHIFAEICAAGGPLTCSPFLEVDMRPIPKSTLSQHFRVLRDAGLVRSERKGVEMHNVARLEDLHPRFTTLLQAIVQAHKAQVARDSRHKLKPPKPAKQPPKRTARKRAG
jgi:DNA-binding transcriptional ArsR family regulator